MSTGAFDIYRTESEYVAVSHEVRRQILLALAKKDRGLPELVKLTRKAKPTLSSVHMRDLLARRLVEEIAHPTDKRKKIYRLRATRIGSSHLPLDQLRSAVQEYASRSLQSDGLPLAVAMDALGAAPLDASDEGIRAQARRLGVGAAFPLVGRGAHQLVPEVAAVLARERVAQPLRLDLEAPRLEVQAGASLPAVADARALAILAGFVEGLLAERIDAPVQGEVLGARRYALGIPFRAEE